MATYTIVNYLDARLPNLATDLPTIDKDMLATGAMALYWGIFFPPSYTPQPTFGDETVLTERQKVICALRAAVSVFPAILAKYAKGLVVEAHGGPAGAKFADPSKVYKQLGDMMLQELELMESAEGIVLKPDAGIPPAYLLTIDYPPDSAATAETVVQRGIIQTN